MPGGLDRSIDRSAAVRPPTGERSSGGGDCRRGCDGDDGDDDDDDDEEDFCCVFSSWKCFLRIFNVKSSPSSHARSPMTQDTMYAKGKGSTAPSDAQAREKYDAAALRSPLQTALNIFTICFRLALYVYEYLLHVGAQKAAQTFLNEVRHSPCSRAEARTCMTSRDSTRR